MNGPPADQAVRAVECELETLYGSPALAPAGIVHVAYVARDAQGRLCPLRIGPDVPRSESDFFVLSLCRARADAILTSAQNVRSEPLLSHRLTGRWTPALAAYRQQLGKHAPPHCAILTHSGDLPSEHAVWGDGTSKVLLTGGERVQALAARWGERAQVVGLEAPSARSACAWLQSSGAALISVEAGPSTAAALYREPPLVDELLLTILEGGPPAPALLAAALPEDAQLLRGLTLTGSTRREEGGHAFRYERWARRP